MAQTGKKINELTQISTVTNETVLPAVYVSGGNPSTTANKVSIEQISNKITNDLSTILNSKQDKLTAGEGIDITNNVISCDVDALPDQTDQSGKFLTTNGTSASWATVHVAPTLTWYTDNAGTTVTIADTSSSNLVKIYKNGILLQPTADYSISGTTLTLVTALESTDKITVEQF